MPDVNDARIAAAIKETCSTGDVEADHVNADNYLCALLRELGYHKVVDAWVEVDRWYA